ncbi:hypothetical protein [Flavobacterium selenitireducens]|uniref:hypothetical protein n=1 Tax=Flavobacterium selenitireducens TaxID=2722704 RepID=UPI00168BC003|nr:hypothetical protein [Flavobacterium selenitireducens]MBD3583628.1 hypothetical protein [Flavobacterium selenitireducens]
MKKLQLLSLALLLALSYSCKNDDEGDNNTTLEGTWKLRNVQGGFGGANETFEPGAITWTFDLSDSTVTVVNSQPESEYDFFETGVYDFSMVTTGQPGNCNTSATIAQTDFGCITLNGTTLKFSQAAADGFDITLKR